MTLAELATQKEQFAILAEVNRLRAIGNARVEIMQNQLGAGLVPT